MKTRPEDATGWPIHQGARVRVHPDRNLKAYSGTVNRIFEAHSFVDGEEIHRTILQVRRDGRAYYHLVDPEVCTVLRQAPEKKLPIRTASAEEYKNPFTSDKGEA